jgi:hypothetical protein
MKNPTLETLSNGSMTIAPGVSKSRAWVAQVIAGVGILVVNQASGFASPLAPELRLRVAGSRMGRL